MHTTWWTLRVSVDPRAGDGEDLPLPWRGAGDSTLHRYLRLLMGLPRRSSREIMLLALGLIIGQLLPPLLKPTPLYPGERVSGSTSSDHE